MQYSKEFTINLPDFLLVGVAKSGTTSIHRYLSKHPEIFLPSIKETWFFHLIDNPNKVILDLMPTLPLSFLSYAAHFEDAQANQKCGEITPSYLQYYELTIKNIKKYHPDWRKLKIIIILREPIEKIISHYNYVHGRKLDPENLGLMESLRQEEKRMKTNRYIPDVFYVDNTRYFRQVKAYLETFEKVKIFLYEDLKQAPKKFMKELCEFIEVAPIAPSMSHTFNRSQPRRLPSNTLAALILRHKNLLAPYFSLRFKKGLDRLLRKDEKIEPEAIEYLKPIFKEEVMKLQGLIGRDLQHWLEKY